MRKLFLQRLARLRIVPGEVLGLAQIGKDSQSQRRAVHSIRICLRSLLKIGRARFDCCPQTSPVFPVRIWPAVWKVPPAHAESKTLNERTTKEYIAFITTSFYLTFEIKDLRSEPPEADRDFGKPKPEPDTVPRFLVLTYSGNNFVKPATETVGCANLPSDAWQRRGGRELKARSARGYVSGYRRVKSCARAFFAG